MFVEYRLKYISNHYGQVPLLKLRRLFWCIKFLIKIFQLNLPSMKVVKFIVKNYLINDGIVVSV